MLLCSYANAAYWPYCVEARFHYGAMYRHHQEFDYLSRGHTPGLELGLLFRPPAEQAWAQAYHYPQWGFAYRYTDLAFPRVLGQAHALYGLIDLPLTGKPPGSFWQMYMRIGLGPSYLTRHFDEYTNNFNAAIGSAYNVFVLFAWNHRLRITPRLSLLAGIDMIHYSNGAMRRPNFGINVFALNAGLKWQLFLNTDGDYYAPDTISDSPSRTEYLVWSSVGWHDHGKPGDILYRVYNFTAEANRVWHGMSALKIGADLFYNSYMDAYLEEEEIDNNSPFRMLATGLHLGYSQHVGPLRMGVAMGYYLYNEEEAVGTYYHRLIFRYRFSPHWFANFSLHSHFAVANNFEWGLGYIINAKE